MRRTKDYVEIWSRRCYDEIPDDIPPLLAASNRAPSWKSVAMALLNNDHLLHSLGFCSHESALSDELMRAQREKRSGQLRLVK